MRADKYGYGHAQRNAKKQLEKRGACNYAQTTTQMQMPPEATPSVLSDESESSCELALLKLYGAARRPFTD